MTQKTAHERGPVEVIEKKGIKISIYRSDAFGKESFLVSYYLNKERKRERAGTIEAARKLAKRKIDEITTGSAHVKSFTPREHAVILDALEVLRPVNVPLSEAVRSFAEAYQILGGRASLAESARFYVESFERAKIPEKSFKEVVSEFHENSIKAEKSWQYRRDMRSRLDRAAKTFAKPILSITTEEIDHWLGQGKRSARTQNNDRKAISILFNFAKKRGYLPKAAETAADRALVRKEIAGEPAILSPQEFRKLLSETPQKFLPLVTLGGLAGLRTAEIARIDWSEIDLEQEHLVVSAAKAKTGSRRIVPICEALKQLLQPLAKESGPVMPYKNEQSMLNGWTKTKNKLISVEIPQNALRHTYGSCQMAILEDSQKVASLMGNSPRKVYEHYRKLVTKTVGEEWFNVKSKEF